ncbi:amino acid permease, partial [Streptococcus agalactiae]
YAASRMLFGMAKEGHAPKVFAKTNTSNGVPIYAILATVAIGLLAFLTSIFGTEIYFYLVAASGLSGFLAWIGIAICHFRFRRAFIKQGHKLSELGYHAKWFPIG